MINNKFIHYETQAGFEADNNNGNIANDSIVFVKENKKIYTHGTEYDGTETYSRSQIDNMISASPEYIVVDTKEELDSLTEHPSGAVYRVANYDGSVPQVDTTVYSEYAWDGSSYILLDVKGFGIDNVPTEGSDNAVKSGSVYKAYAHLVYLGDDEETVITGFDPQADTIHKAPQVLSNAEKAQVIQNIGAVSVSEMNQVRADINNVIEQYTPILIEGDVTNAPDEEDLTSINVAGTDVLKLKDKAYSPTTYSGMGRKYLRKNMVNNVNILTQEMFEDNNGNDLENTIFVIQYDYTIGEGREVTLEFDNSTTVVTDEYKDASDDLEDAINDYNNASSDLTTKQATLTQKESELAALISGGGTEEEIAQAEAAVEEAEEAVDEAQEVFDAAEEAKDTAQDVLDNTQHYYNYATVNLLAGECIVLQGNSVGLNDARTAKSYNKGSAIYADTNITVTIGNIDDTEDYSIERFIVIPSNSVLKFEGGSINNGIIRSDEGINILSTTKCFSNIKFVGKCKQSLVADLRWFVNKYPKNTSDTTVDNTQEVIQCLNCGTRSVLFPTDKFIRLTQTIEVNQQINILTDNKDKQMFAGFSGNIRRELEIPCVFSEQVVTLFKYHLGAFDGYGEKYYEPFIIGNINLVTTKPYSTISLDPESSDYRGTPVLYIDNKYAKGQVWGIKLNCNIASKTCSVPIDLNTSTTKKTGYNWTGIDIRTVPDVYTSTCHAFAFLEINGDIYNLAMGFVTSKGDDGTNGWFNDVIVRGHIECSFGCDSKCGGPLVVYGTHQTRGMHSSLLTQKGYFKSSHIYMFGWVWDCGSTVDSTTGWVRANSEIETTTRNAFRSFTPAYRGVSYTDYRFPNPVIIGEPITDNRDLRKFPNLLYYGLGTNTSYLLTNLDYSIQFVGELDFVPSLYTGRIINEHCLFNDAMASPYNADGAYPALGNTKLDVAYTTSDIYKVKVSFDLTIYSRSSFPTFLLIGNQVGTDTSSIKQAKIAIKTRSTNTGEWTILYSEENPLVLGSFHSNYFDRYWRVNLPKLGMSHYSHISIEVDYSDPKAKSKILPFISIPWFYGDVPKYRDCENDKLPVIYKYNRGWNTFNRTINKPVWWDGTTWVDAEGHNIAAKTIGTTAERPISGVNGTLTSNDVGFEYYDTDLNKPIYAQLINETTGIITWADSEGYLEGYNDKQEIKFREGYALKNLRIDSGVTDESFMENTVITNINSCIVKSSSNSNSAVIFEAGAGDIISVKGVSSFHNRLWYVINKSTGKITAISSRKSTENPSKPFLEVIEITADSWVACFAYNQNYTRTVDGVVTPFPYRNSAGTSYKIILYSNKAANEYPTYGSSEDRPTTLDAINTGFCYFDTTINKPIYWNGVWYNSAGTRVTWELTYALTHITASNDQLPNANSSYITILTADEGYSLPSSITVAIGSTTLTVDTDYAYDSTTGEIKILGIGGVGGITDTLTITATGEQTNNE